MAELAKNMEDLDKESATLYDQLGNLEADLRKETSNFDETVCNLRFLKIKLNFIKLNFINLNFILFEIVTFVFFWIFITTLQNF